jgi:class 3 adenylate cyclase
VTETIETHYAVADDGAHIAYQVLGQGPPDLLVMMTSALPVEDQMEGRQCGRFLRRLASFSRVIRLDRRGIGMSDPVRSFDEHVFERWVDDVLTVLDAVGSDHTAFFGTEQPSCTAPILLAATHPDRVSRLILYLPSARALQAPDYPYGVAPEDANDQVEAYVQSLISGTRLETVGFSEPDGPDPDFHGWYLRARRRGATPSVARAIFDNWLKTDLRSVLPAVSIPTLVFGRPDASGDPRVVSYVAEHIREARYVELGGDNTLVFLGDIEPVIGEVERFLTGSAVTRVSDRVLATVLFSDIVGSTTQAADLGDRAWGERLEDHDALVRRQLELFRGREIKTTGDGFLATFDGPARAVLCGCAIRDATRGLGVNIRVGVHTGEIELRGNDIGGIAVSFAARVAAQAGTSEVLVSKTVTDLVAGSGIEFDDRGEYELKGVPGTWNLFSVRG